MHESNANLPRRFTSRTLGESIYERLRNDIIAGRLEPTAKLGIEELRETYETSASPLREDPA